MASLVKRLLDEISLLREVAVRLADLEAEVEHLTDHVKERERVWTERERVAFKEAQRLEAAVERLQADPRLALTTADLKWAAEQARGIAAAADADVGGHHLAVVLLGRAARFYAALAGEGGE